MEKYFFLLKIWFSVKLVFIFAPRKTFFYTRNLLRKVEGIDPAKPWQPALEIIVRCQIQPREIGKDKSEISFKIVLNYHTNSFDLSEEFFYALSSRIFCK